MSLTSNMRNALPKSRVSTIWPVTSCTSLSACTISLAATPDRCRLAEVPSANLAIASAASVEFAYTSLTLLTMASSSGPTLPVAPVIESPMSSHLAPKSYSSLVTPATASPMPPTASAVAPELEMMPDSADSATLPNAPNSEVTPCRAPPRPALNPCASTGPRSRPSPSKTSWAVRVTSDRLRSSSSV